MCVRAPVCAHVHVHEYAPVSVSAHMSVGLGSLVCVELLSSVKNIILFEAYTIFVEVHEVWAGNPVFSSAVGLGWVSSTVKMYQR